MGDVPDPEADAASDSREPRLPRRAIVAGGLAGVIGSALTRLQTAHAQEEFESQPLLLGVENFAAAPTGLAATGAGPALRVENVSEGPTIGPALEARSTTTALLAVGGLPDSVTFSDTRAAVVGAGSRLGVFGTALSATGTITATRTATAGVPVGVWGSGGALGAGVTITATRGATLRGVGVWGSAPVLPGAGPITYTVPTAGVVGTAFGAEQTAMLAHNPSGTALQVNGRLALTCGGRGVVPRLKDTVKVADPSIKEGSVVMITLTGDPGNKGTSLHHVKVYDGELRVVLTARPRFDVPFSYLCFELA